MEYNYKKLTEKEIADAIEKNDTVFMEVDGTVRRVAIDDLVNASSLRTDFENGVQSESDFTVDTDVAYGEGSVISDEWSISKVYSTGDYCIYNNCLYRCKVQNINVTPANTTYWESVLVCDEISRLSGSVNTLNSNLQYKIYKSWLDFGMDDVETHTTEEIISQMPEFSILIKALWRDVYPNMHFPDATTNNRCIYTIIKSLEGYSIVKHFEVDTGNMYICGYRNRIFSDWNSI